MTKSLDHQASCGDEVGTWSSWEVKQKVEIGSDEGKQESDTARSSPRQAHSDKEGPRSSWDVSPWVRVQISRSHGKAEAWLWLSWRLALLRHSGQRMGAQG